MIRALAKYAPLPWLRSRWPHARFCKDQRGASAVEFALLLPVMLVLYLGGVEVSKAITISRKVTLASRTISDLVAQVTTVNAAGIANVLKAGEAVTGMFNDPLLKLRVSSVKIDALGVSTVVWSKTTASQTPHAVDAPVTVPAGIKIPNTFLIWAEVEYFYKPAIGGGAYSIIKEGITLQDKIYMRPRLSDSVACEAC